MQWVLCQSKNQVFTLSKAIIYANFNFPGYIQVDIILLKIFVRYGDNILTEWAIYLKGNLSGPSGDEESAAYILIANRNQQHQRLRRLNLAPSSRFAAYCEMNNFITRMTKHTILLIYLSLLNIFKWTRYLKLYFTHFLAYLIFVSLIFWRYHKFLK